MYKDHASKSGGSASANPVSRPAPLARGREFLSIPGPTNVPEAVLQAMHRPAVDIYADELLETTGQCLEDLKRVFPHRRVHLHLYRQWPWCLGSRADQHSVAR